MAKPLIPKSYKATPTTIKIILDAIADGLTQRDASILAGISEDTLSLWKRQNSDFSEQIRQKEIECKRRHIKNIEKASEKSWQASAWWLERKYKNEFSQRVESQEISEELRESMDRSKKMFDEMFAQKIAKATL
ncbi:MAG: hypothetical protein RL150_249 [Candidatus Parcubacteria bacterium]|jgi:hypothetical protein